MSLYLVCVKMPGAFRPQIIRLIPLGDDCPNGYVMSRFKIKGWLLYYLPENCWGIYIQEKIGYIYKYMPDH